MSICKYQLKDLIERTLKKVPEFYSEDATTLLMMTCAAESDLGKYLFQHGGPAKGIFQVEPRTMSDNFGRYLYFRDRLKEDIRLACGVGEPDVDSLEYNLAFNILMARLKYWRDSEPIPSDLEDMAHYHKRVYNSMNGKAHWEVTLAKYKFFCL